LIGKSLNENNLKKMSNFLWERGRFAQQTRGRAVGIHSQTRGKKLERSMKNATAASYKKKR